MTVASRANETSGHLDHERLCALVTSRRAQQPTKRLFHFIFCVFVFLCFCVIFNYFFLKKITFYLVLGLALLMTFVALRIMLCCEVTPATIRRALLNCCCHSVSTSHDISQVRGYLM